MPETPAAAPPHPLTGMLRTVIVTVLASAIGQTGFFFYWAGGLSQKVEILERGAGDDIQVQRDIASIKTALQDISRRLDRIEQRANLTFLAPEDRP